MSVNILFQKLFLILILLCFLLVWYGSVYGVTTCSHSSNIEALIVTCTPDADATNITASLWLSVGFFFNDKSVNPRNSPVVFTYPGTSGEKYSLLVYETREQRTTVVYNKTVAIEPAKPINVKVQSRGESFLFLSWETANGTSSESHEISYRRENEAAPNKLNTDRNKYYNLTNLSPGYSYEITIQAITLDKRSERSELITESTAPLPPMNLIASPLTSSTIRVSWFSPSSSFQESYQVQYLTSKREALNISGCTASPCTFSPDVPSGVAIAISVYSVSHGVLSSAATIESSTKPKQVTSLNGTSRVAGLTLFWTAPTDSEQVNYTIIATKVTNTTDIKMYMEPADNRMEITRELTDLQGGYLYEVNVQAQSLYAKGDNYSKTFFTAPEPVSNLKSVAVNTTTMNVIWSLPNKSRISSLTLNVSPGSPIKLDGRAQSYQITGLTAGKLYTISVLVYSDLNWNIPSPAAEGKFRTKPVKPKVTSVAAEENALTISLTRETDEGDFDLIVTQLNSSSANVAGGQVRFDRLMPGSLYLLGAYTLSGQERSDNISAVVFTKPKPPRNLVVNSNRTSITARWDSPEIGGLDNFTVTLLKSGLKINQLSVIENVVSFPSLEAGATYSVTVVAVKGDQVSSEETKENTTVPLPVTQVRVSARGVSSTTIAWGAPVGSSLEGYALTFPYLNLTLLSLPKDTLQYRLEGLQPGANYTLTLFTYTNRMSDKVILYSTPTQFNFSTYPDSVAALQKVLATTDSITVNWTAPTSVEIDLYQLGILVEDVTTKPNEPAQVLAKNVTNATFSNLEPGFFYTIAIRTVKTGVAGQAPQFGLAVRLKTVTKPLPVVNLDLSTINTTALAARWSLNKTSKQNWVQVQYGDKLLRLAASNQSDFNIVLSALLPGSAYNVSVQAIRSNDSDEEKSRETIVRGFTAPMPVLNLNVTSDRSRILVSWSPPGLGGISSYNIYYRPILRGAFIGLSSRSTNTTSMRLSDLFPGEKYQINVTSISNGLESTSVTGEAVIDPDPPRYLLSDKSKTTSSSINVYWSYDHFDTYTERWTIQVVEGTFLVTKEVEQVEGQTEYDLEIDQLTPGHTYNVSIKSHVLNRISSEISTNVTTKPVINSIMKESASTNSSIAISYTVTREDIFDHFIFSISGVPGAEPVNRSKSYEPTSVEFSGLQAGTKYTVQAWSAVKDEASSPISIDIFTDPNPVPVHLTSTSKTVSLLLGPQVGQAAQYTIVCNSADGGQSCGEKTLPALVPLQPIVFSELLPYHEYNFRVITKTTSVNNSVKMATEEFRYRTAEAPPGPVRSFSVVDKDLHTVVLSWEPPLLTNGDIKYYTVAYSGSEADYPEIKDEKVLEVNGLSHTITDLKAGFKYTFKVSAFTIEKGDEDTREIVMKTAAPAFKANQDALRSRPQASKDKDTPLVTQTQISFDLQNPFSQDNGRIRYYTVIASLDPTGAAQDTRLSSWLDVQKDKSLKVYLAANCTDLFSPDSTCGVVPGGRPRRAASTLDSRVFVLGADSKQTCAHRPYCNGPLTPGTEYSVKLRAYTLDGQHQETAYSDKVKTIPSGSGQAGVIAAAVIVPILVIVIVILLFFKLRNKPKRATSYSAPKLNWKQTAMSHLSRPIKLVDFPMHVSRMSSDSDLKYAEEFEDLKDVGRDQPCSAAEFPPNRPKNRFTNILPYDHSRVKLLPTDDEEGSDYINANYMPGYTSKREYIATQGPLPSTRDDFWRMIWEQNCRNIVMLTRCQEKGREKSDHYWPNDSEPKFYGDLQVLILNETHMPDWTITEFKVSMGVQSRNVRHFHYLVWPDFGVPKNCTSLIRFVRTVREKIIREGGPIVTHCSAGVGRSGTYIVLDHLLQLIREKDEVDVFSLVYRLRKERVLMVQTERFRPRGEVQEYFSLQQYKFIHECLVCVLEGREEDITYMNFGQINATFEVDVDTDFGINLDNDDEGINVESM